MTLRTTAPIRRQAAARNAPDGARPSLSPDSLIDAATEVLAGRLGVTRGSFYHHFREREDLLRRLLQAWRERTTEQLTARLEHASADPREQLADVLSLPLRGRSAERAARIELALRAWARRDAMARQFVDEADASRLLHIGRVFAALGFAAAESRSRAFMVYSYVVAESLLNTTHSPAQRRDRSAFVSKLMCGTLEP